MVRQWRCLGAGALIAAVVIAYPVVAQDDKSETKDRGKASGKTSQAERVAGVVVKVEPILKGATPGSTVDRLGKEGKEPERSYRLTINADAVWQDWVRDQATLGTVKTTPKAARSGANSVATKGQPATADTTVLVDVGPDTRVETRFRSPTDETTKGAATPEEAREEDDSTPDTAKSKPRAGSSKSTEKGPSFGVGDLKPGLFVEAEYRHVAAQNPASVVTVIRPLGGPDTSAKEAAPASKTGTSKDR